MNNGFYFMSLKKNILGLAVSQIFTYIVPLLQFPYLSRSVGHEYFGLLVYTLTLTQIAMLITDFGFDISVVKKIAEGDNSKHKLGCYLYQTTIIKTMLLFLSLMLVFLCLYNIDNKTTKISSGYYFFVFLTVLLNSYNIRWLFQGIEKIYVYANIVIVSRIVSLILIFIFVKSENDVIYYPVALAIQGFLITVPCYIFIKKKGVKAIRTSFNDVKIQFVSSFEYFLSRACVALYSSGCSVFLGTFGHSMQQVAFYGVAEQLYKAGVQVFSPVISALVPYMVRTKNYILFYKIVIGSICIVSIGMAAGFLFGDKIIYIIYGNGFEESKVILDIFMIIIPASVLGMLFGYPAMLPLNLGFVANRSVFVSGFIQIVMLATLLIYPHYICAVVVAISYLICDWVMFIIRFIYFLRNIRGVHAQR